MQWRRRIVSIATAIASGACVSPAPPAPVAAHDLAHPAVNHVEIVVAQREAASAFETFDNASLWWSGKCDQRYRDDWRRRFGVSPEDEQRFADYKAIRKRYYPYPAEESDDPTKTDHGLFAPQKPIDRFAEAFYSSDTIAEAISKLASVVSPADREAVRAIFEAYRTQLAMLLPETQPYIRVARAMQRRLSDAHADDFYRRLSAFYRVPASSRFTVLYVYWPEGEHIEANTRGSYLLLKYAASQSDAALRDVEIPVHELTHFVSAHQPPEQKRELTRAFLTTCRVNPPPSGEKALEEPMAVVFQKLFLIESDPKRFDLGAPWYGGDRWIDPFSKRILGGVSEVFQRQGKLHPELVARLGTLCASPAPTPAASTH